MRKVLAVAVAVLVVSAGPAMAQKRVEISGIVGWTFSDGVAGDAVLAPDGNTYNAIDLKDGFNWGLMFGILATDNVEFGFMFNQQQSALRLQGTRERELGDSTINGYHGYFAYNFGDAEAKFRPYILGGLGATNFGSVDYTNVAGNRGTIPSATKFSTTWGAGVKFYPAPSVGIRAGIRWTPAYITTEGGGWWCDPYWGCYVVGNAKYANQFEFSGGVAVRF